MNSKIVRRMITGACLASSAQAWAAPVYLHCSIGGPPRPALVDVTADEVNSIVTIMVDGTPAPQRFTASFSPGRVVFGDGFSNYTLDRSTLAIVREVRRYGMVDRGECRLEKAVKRAF